MNELETRWQASLQSLPLIAILRGIQPSEALSIGEALLRAEFSLVEVPLNSPSAFDTIEKLNNAFGDKMLVGAGTVLTADQVATTVEVGGKLIVAPNLDEAVAGAAAQFDCVYCPGVGTPTEAFQALQLGANALKLFPAEMLLPAVVKAMHAVLPKGTITLPVGGITPVNMKPYLDAGSIGFGIGSSLYSTGKSTDDVHSAAQAFVTAYREWRDE